MQGNFLNDIYQGLLNQTHLDGIDRITFDSSFSGLIGDQVGTLVNVNVQTPLVYAYSSVTGTGLLSVDLGTITTADIKEEAPYLYYTDARARAAISAGSTATIAYNATTGEIDVANPLQGSITWEGNVVGTRYGGTGNNWTLAAANQIPYMNGTGTLGLIAAGTPGQVLTAGGGGVPGWATPTAATVTAVNGTANQITATTVATVVTLTLPSAVVTPGTLATAGVFSAGGSPSGTCVCNVSGTANATFFTGPAGIECKATLANSTFNTALDMFGVYSAPTVNFPVGNTGNFFNCYLKAETSTGAAAARSYGLYVEQPTAGTTKYATYLANLVVGNSNPGAPPTNGAYFEGNVKCNQLTASSLVATDSSQQLTSSISGLSPTFTAVTATAGMQAANIGVGAAPTTIYGAQINASNALEMLRVQGTMTGGSGVNLTQINSASSVNFPSAAVTYKNLWLVAATYTGSTPAKAYSVYAEAPGGTHSYAIYGANLVIGATDPGNPPTNGAYVEGSIKCNALTASRLLCADSSQQISTDSTTVAGLSPTFTNLTLSGTLGVTGATTLTATTATAVTSGNVTCSNASLTTGFLNSNGFAGAAASTTGSASLAVTGTFPLAGWYNLGTIILTSSSATMAFSTIPAQFVHLRMVGKTRYLSTDTAGWIKIGVGNGSIDSSGNHYAYSLLYSSGSTANGVTATSRNSSETSFWGVATEFTNVEVVLPYYSDANHKIFLSQGGAGNSTVALQTTSWNQTGAITNIQITASGTAKFDTGSQLTLYGSL